MRDYDGRAVIQPNYFPDTELLLKRGVCLDPQDVRFEDCQLYVKPLVEPQLGLCAGRQKSWWRCGRPSCVWAAVGITHITAPQPSCGILIISLILFFKPNKKGVLQQLPILNQAAAEVTPYHPSTQLVTSRWGSRTPGRRGRR
jgi:hypothetical protein